MNNLARELNIIQEALEPKVLETPLPIPVQRFCAEVSKNFSITVNSLRATASRLREAAAELDSRAKDLEDASPDLRGHIERWVQFERESNERGSFLNTLFDKR